MWKWISYGFVVNAFVFSAVLAVWLSNDFTVINFKILNILSQLYLINYNGLMEAVRGSYPVIPESCNDFIMIQICSWRGCSLHFHFWRVFIYQHLSTNNVFKNFCISATLAVRLSNHFLVISFKILNILS